MEVILVNPVRKLGKIGDILNVADGFARNYLIPKKLAIRATESNRKTIEEKKHEFELKDQKVKSEAEITNALIQDRELIFIKQAADDGRLFGSVSNKDVAMRLSEISGHQILPSTIVLDKPVKSVGCFVISVRLHAELSADVIVVVARTESEAQEHLSKRSSQES